MVDVPFPFIILVGGLVAARVRRHTGWRKAPDILAAATCAAGAGARRPVPRRLPGGSLRLPLVKKTQKTPQGEIDIALDRAKQVKDG